MSKIGQFEVRDQITIRDAWLRGIRNGLIQRGVTNPNVSPNSDWYVQATAIAAQLAVTEANGVTSVDDLMPDTATGTNTDRWLGILGLARRDAAGSVGQVTITSSATTTIAAGTQLIDSAGLLYQVTQSGSYANGSQVPIAAISTGRNTNHANGDVLRWVAAPSYCQPQVTVGIFGGTDGLTGGTDAEDDPTATARLLSRFGTPASAGNAQHVAELAEASHSSVQKAFPYPAAQGPGTCHVAVAGYSTAALALLNGASGVTANRDISGTTLAGSIAPYIRGYLPEYADLTITTVANVNTDVAFGLNLPAATTASPPGPGGGWLDGTPWPYISGSAYTKAAVTSVTSANVFAIDAPTAPTAGVSRIAFLDPNTWLLRTGTVLSFTGTGPYTVTVDQPFTGIAVGALVWPQSVNQVAYCVAALQAFAQMGPGEKSANPTVLARAYRHPVPQRQWPSSLGGVQLKALTNVGTEVLDAQYYYRSTTTPAVPGTITNAPNILVPRYIAFYAL